MGIRNINNITEDNSTIIKIVNEGKHKYTNEKRAYQILKEYLPNLIKYDDIQRSLFIEKINGRVLTNNLINRTVVINLAKALKYVHSHKKKNKCLIHGDLHKDNILVENNQIYLIDFCCSTYSIKEVDFAAIEIHVIKDRKLLKLFYETYGEFPNIELLKKEKVNHCLKHLEWATKDNFKEMYLKSKRIITQNDSLIKEDDFDYLGLIKIGDNKKIENLVSKIKNNLHVSRSEEYYSKKTYNELVNFREELKRLFPLSIKKAFIVCEYMLNASYRVYYQDYKLALNNKQNNLQISQKCMESDVENIIFCLKNKVIDIPKYELKNLENDTYVENRLIESDHKMLLYKMIKSLKDIPYVVCPLYSSILIGPFFKVIHKCNYAYVKFGIHDQNMKHIYEANELTLDKISITKKIPKELTIIDGNIGSGLTLKILKELFENNGLNPKIGTLEVSYEYMEKNKDFSILDDLDYKTYISTRHHTITDNIVNELCTLPRNYINKLKNYGFQNEFIGDLELLYNRGKSICESHQIEINSFVQYDSNFVLSMDIMNKKIRYLEEYPVEKAIKIIRDFQTVNIIDLDRFYGEEQSLEIIKKIIKLKKVRVGGGIRTREEIQKILDLGAEKVIIGTHATPNLLKGFDPERILVGLDSIDRRTNTIVNIPEKIKIFEPYCSEFNYVSVEHDGKAKGGDIKNAIKYAKLTKNRLNCVGGINTKTEMYILKKHHIGCTIGRKIQEGYFGKSNFN